MNRIATEYGHAPQHPEVVTPSGYEERLRAIVRGLHDLGVDDLWVSYSVPTDHILHHTGRLPRAALRALQTPTVFPWCDTRLRPFRRGWGSRERHQWTISVLFGFRCESRDERRKRTWPGEDAVDATFFAAMAGAPMLAGMPSADRHAAVQACYAALRVPDHLIAVGPEHRRSPQEVFNEELERLGVAARARDIITNPDHE
jgi:hypothetical protein